jgi:hypothetical protein
MNKKERERIELETKIIFDYLETSKIEDIIRLWIDRQTYYLKRNNLEEMPIYITHSIEDIQKFIDEFKHNLN